jgi:hypothetical protein
MLLICRKHAQGGRGNKETEQGFIPFSDDVLGFQSSCLHAEMQFESSPQLLCQLRSASLLPGAGNVYVHSL